MNYCINMLWYGDDQSIHIFIYKISNKIHAINLNNTIFEPCTGAHASGHEGRSH